MLGSAVSPQVWERRALKAVTLKGINNVGLLISPQRQGSWVLTAVSKAVQHSGVGGPPWVIAGRQTAKPAAQFITSLTEGLGASGRCGPCPDTVIAAISNVARRKITVVVWAIILIVGGSFSFVLGASLISIYTQYNRVKDIDLVFSCYVTLCDICTPLIGIVYSWTIVTKRHILFQFEIEYLYLA